MNKCNRSMKKPIFVGFWIVKIAQILLVIIVPTFLLHRQELMVEHSATAGQKGMAINITEKSLFCFSSFQTDSDNRTAHRQLMLTEEKQPSQELATMAICVKHMKSNMETNTDKCLCMFNWHLIVTVILAVISLLCCLIDMLLLMNYAFVYSSKQNRNHAVYLFVFFVILFFVWCLISIFDFLFFRNDWPYYYTFGKNDTRYTYYKHPVLWSQAVNCCFLFTFTISLQTALHFVNYMQAHFAENDVMNDQEYAMKPFALEEEDSVSFEFASPSCSPKNRQKNNSVSVSMSTTVSSSNSRERSGSPKKTTTFDPGSGEKTKSRK